MTPPSLEFHVRRGRVEPSASPLVILDLAVRARPGAVRSILLATQVRIALERQVAIQPGARLLLPMAGFGLNWQAVILEKV